MRVVMMIGDTGHCTLHTVPLSRLGSSLTTDGESEPFIWLKLMPSCQLELTISHQAAAVARCLNGGDWTLDRWLDTRTRIQRYRGQHRNTVVPGMEREWERCRGMCRNAASRWRDSVTVSLMSSHSYPCDSQSRVTCHVAISPGHLC